MKQTKKGFVEVPATTLNALKNMLFNNEGVDLTNIIDDLTPNAESRDLTAINVALAYKGVQIDIDKSVHYVYDWGNRFYTHTFVGVSLILGIVKTQRALWEIDEQGNIIEKQTNYDIECHGLNEWCAWSTDIADMQAEYEKRKQK
jgi:hypothetical protein